MTEPRRPDFLFASTYPIVFDEGRLAAQPLGGSETALVEVSRGLAGRGLAVEVFAPDPRQGLRGGVRWDRVDTLETQLGGGQVRPRVLVICRDAALAPLSRGADATWLWLQDMPMEGFRKIFRAAVMDEHVDRVLCISDYQRDRFARVFDIPAEVVAARFSRTRNGLDLAAHAEALKGAATAHGRVPGRCVYASAPFRGLDPLLVAWPEIQARAPHATLEVLGGMVTYDQPDDPFAHLYTRAADLPGVTVRGAVPQAELVRALRQAELLLYPCTFREAGCIVVQMAHAAGTPPVTSSMACLPEYVGRRGVLVPDHPRGGGPRAEAFLKAFVHETATLLGDGARIALHRSRCAEHDVGWAAVLDQCLAWADEDEAARSAPVLGFLRNPPG